MNNGYIIEDHPSAQQWLQDALQTAFPGIRTTISASVEEAHSQLNDGYPDIALIDLNLPDGSGVEIIDRINRESPHTATIVTTIYDDDTHLFPALRAGAKGYILKEQRQEDICRLLKGIVNGEPPLSPTISQRLLKHFSSMGTTLDLEQKALSLTAREKEVLSLIAQGHSLSEAAKLLGITRNTIASQVKSIYSKLNISNRAQAALAASQIGILSIRNT